MASFNIDMVDGICSQCNTKTYVTGSRKICLGCVAKNMEKDCYGKK